MLKSGSKYGHLTAVGRVDGPGGMWLVKCDCGNVSEKRGKYITSGRVKTCGKCHLGRRLMATRGRVRITGDLGYQKLYNAALTRGETAGLSYDVYVSKIKQNCAFCGSEPCHRTRGPKVAHNYLVIPKEVQVVTAEDVWTACPRCLKKMGQDSAMKFLEYLIKCTEHLNNLLAKY